MRLDELLNSLVAVHVTSVLPKDGILRPGIMDVEHITRMVLVNAVPNMSCTLRWQLGQASLEDYFAGRFPEQSLLKKPLYAVVTRLENIVEQMLNISVTNTITVGNYRLTENDYIILPTNTKLDGTVLDKCGAKTKYYNENRHWLDIPVFFIISKMHAWHVSHTPATDDTPAKKTIKFDSAISEINIDSKDFFQPILDAYPNVMFTQSDEIIPVTHIVTLIKLIDTFIYNYMLVLFNLPGDNLTHLYAKLLLLNFLIVDLRLFFTAIMDSQLNPAAKSYVLHKILSQSNWLNIIVLEIRANAIGKTVANVIFHFYRAWEKQQIIQNLNIANNFMLQHASSLRAFNKIQRSHFTLEDVELLYGTSNTDLRKQACTTAAETFTTFHLGASELPYPDVTRFALHDTLGVHFPEYTDNLMYDSERPSRVFGILLHHHRLLRTVSDDGPTTKQTNNNYAALGLTM